MGVVRVKDGVQFTVIGPAGFRILSALDQEAAALDRDLEVTSACDGPHSGPGDPHHDGNAYDIRTHDFPNDGLKLMVLDGIMRKLDPAHFWGFLEHPGQIDEHIHVQRKKGTTYP